MSLSIKLLSLVLVFFFTGCMENVKVLQIPSDYKSQSMPLQVCNISGLSASVVCDELKDYEYKGSSTFVLSIVEKRRFPESPANSRNILALQSAAEVSLKYGYSYFAFDFPREIANTKGNTLHTAEEFIKACNTTTIASDILSLNTYKDGCGIPMSGKLVVIAFTEKPYQLFTYDAKEVIAYLKKEEKSFSMSESDYYFSNKWDMSERIRFNIFDNKK
ncbi:hypothetical protein SJPD1_0943 [Sulfurospirillum diekertiae]|uniref:Lipoprotein n=1 Tax=Sulfurospirillum diekertiae TaxID=1854492 RepID=A0A290HCA3_9BACT|nr:hypothetical protein [Sulfurospirillum diekertiae]ATB69055.1 hypothetical protein SJPD1_0943 [Sulfurospirillum diekertiae]